MQFSHTSRLYNRLLATRIMHLYCATIMVAVALTFYWWYLLYKPSVVDMNATKQQLNQLREQVEELRKAERTLFGLSQSIDAIKNDIQKTQINNPKYYSQQSLSSIANCAMNAGMSVASCKVCGQREESWCFINDVNGEFKGSFDELMVFFDSLKNLKQAVNVLRCELVRSDNMLYVLHATFSLHYV